MSSALYNLDSKFLIANFKDFLKNDKPGKTEVSQLNLAAVIHQDVGAFDISVKEVPIVTVSKALKINMDQVNDISSDPLTSMICLMIEAFNS